MSVDSQAGSPGCKNMNFQETMRKIEIMQHFANGGQVEFRKRFYGFIQNPWKKINGDDSCVSWNWCDFEFRATVPFHLEVGKTYRARNGGVFTITKTTETRALTNIGCNNTSSGSVSWSLDGRYCETTTTLLDLIEEVEHE